MATKKTQVAKTKNTAVAESYDYGDAGGAGFEDTKGTDLSIPFLNVLQSNSPEVQQSKDGSVRIGMIKNTVTGEVVNGDDGFVFCPVHKEEAFVEWIPRLAGGGFVGLHDPASSEVQDAIEANGGRIPKKGADGKKIPLKIGDNELVETYYMYGLILNDEGTVANGFAVIAFTSTKIKPYRDFLTSMYMLKGKPPMYANRARFKTNVQTNDAGTFANFEISALNDTWGSSLIPPGDELLEDSSRFRDMVLNGLARADFSNQQDDGGSAASGGTGKTVSDDETPF